MPKTTKTAKTETTSKAKKTTKATATKTAKTTKTATAKTAAKNTTLLERAQAPIEMVKDVAAKSLHLSLGLGSYLLDNPREINLGAVRGDLRQSINSLVNKAINKGEKIERAQIEWLTDFERTQRKRINDFLAARKRELERTEATLEEKIEEVIASLDIPTRSDIHQLNRRLNELSKELARQRTTTPRKAAKNTKTKAEAPATAPEATNA